MNDVLSERRATAESRLQELRAALTEALERVRGKACVYLTGSFARGEASQYSDLDLFIAGRGDDGEQRDVIAAYWRDYQDHKNDFIPAFLANDILRLWRTFCVNYEARTQTVPPDRKAKRKLKNYKLKHSRLLTCYSALAYLLGVYTVGNTVAPDDAERMVRLSPTERLQWLPKEGGFSSTRSHIERIIAHYEKFLVHTGAPEEDLVEQFLDRTRSQELLKNANILGDEIYELLQLIGKDNAFRRLLIV